MRGSTSSRGGGFAEGVQDDTDDGSQSASGGTEIGGITKRRTFLKSGAASVAFPGTLSVGSIQDVDTADSDVQSAEAPEIQRGLFKIEEDGTVAFGLITSSDVDQEAQREVAVNSLNVSTDGGTSPEVTRVPELDLNFFERYSLSSSSPSIAELKEEFDLGEDAQEGLQQFERGTGRAQVEVPSERLITGRITDGAMVPDANLRFQGYESRCPRITYDGPVRSLGDDDSYASQFIIQFQDGFNYRFPRDDADYNLDARYDIERVNDATTRVNGLGGTPPFRSAEFRVDLASVSPGGRPAELIPSVTHRAHPALPTLRALAYRRALVLRLLWKYGASAGIEAALNDFQEATTDTVIDIAGTLGPTPPDDVDDPFAWAQSIGLALAPAAAAAAVLGTSFAAAAPAAFVVVSIATTAVSLDTAVDSLEQLGEELSDFKESFSNESLSQVLTEDIKADPTVGTPPTPIEGATTAFSLAQLAQFEAEFAVPALAQSDSLSQLRGQLDSYGELTSVGSGGSEEFVYQFERFDDAFATYPADAEARDGFVSYISSQVRGGSLVTQRRQLLESIEASFTKPSPRFTVSDSRIQTGQVVMFDAAPSQPKFNQTSTYSWEITNLSEGRDEPARSGEQIEVTFSAPGVYAITLRAEDESGNTQAQTRYVDVRSSTTGGQQRDLVFAIDSSGSMQRTDPNDKRIDGTELLLNRLNQSLDRAGLVSWDSNIDFSEPLTREFESLIEPVNRIDSSGGTNINNGLREAIDVHRQSGREDVTSVIVFLTNGQDSGYTPADEGGPAATAADEDIVIFAVGFGNAVESVLNDMADATGGSSFIADSPADLLQIFGEIGQSIGQVGGVGVAPRTLEFGTYALPENQEAATVPTPVRYAFLANTSDNEVTLTIEPPQSLSLVDPATSLGLLDAFIDFRSNSQITIEPDAVVGLALELDTAQALQTATRGGAVGEPSGKLLTLSLSTQDGDTGEIPIGFQIFNSAGLLRTIERTVGETADLFDPAALDPAGADSGAIEAVRVGFQKIRTDANALYSGQSQSYDQAIDPVLSVEKERLTPVEQRAMSTIISEWTGSSRFETGYDEVKSNLQTTAELLAQDSLTQGQIEQVIDSYRTAAETAQTLATDLDTLSVSGMEGDFESAVLTGDPADGQRGRLNDIPGIADNYDLASRAIKRVLSGTVPVLIIAASPVDLVVRDPDGQKLSKEENEIIGSFYREVPEGRADTDALLFIQNKKPGSYGIQVRPEPEASPGDVYSLIAVVGNQPKTLARDREVRNIPEDGYSLKNVFTEPIIALGEEIGPPTDPDRDGLYENVTGSEGIGGPDQSALTRILNSHRQAKRRDIPPGETDGRVQRLTGPQKLAFDFNGDGEFDNKDVAAFARQIK